MKTKRYLMIASNGEIDTKAFELIGASTKADDKTKIGMFGSGLNYSLAFLIRNKIDFHIFSGENQIKFDTKLVDLRGKTFRKIIINGKETSFTDAMGKNWKGWYIIREIYSNALDEGRCQMERNIHPDDVKGKKNQTRFYIEITDEIQEVMEDWELYFSEERKDLLFEAKDGTKVYSGGNDLVVYRKGIRVLNDKECHCAFHYDFPEIEINESRTISSTWELERKIINFWLRQADADLIKMFMRKIRGSYEETLDYHYYDWQMSEQWEKALEGRYIVERELEGHYQELSAMNKAIVLPKEIVDVIIQKQGHEKHVAGREGNKGIKKVEPDDKQTYMLKKAFEFFKETEYKVKYPIEVVEFSKKGILGMADDESNMIYISTQCFESMDLVTRAIIEENEHLISGHGDGSREFQNHLIGLFMEEKKKRFAIVI